MPGWVPVVILLVESGCYGTECSSLWTPDPQKYLFEFKADRTRRGQGEGDGSPPSGLPVRDPRARCMGQWAAGTWYHNAVWTTFWTQEWTCWGTRWVEHWNGNPNWEGWNFAENDRCPQATPTPRPGPTPTRSDPNQQCPATRTTATPPTSKVWFEPPYPVVIAQDPEKKGVDVHIQVTTYPVRYEWQEWEVVGTERHCAWDPDPNVKDDVERPPTGRERRPPALWLQRRFCRQLFGGDADRVILDLSNHTSSEEVIASDSRADLHLTILS